MDRTRQRIQEISLHGYDLDFTAVFSHAFGLYKKTALTAGGVLFVAAIILVVLGCGIGLSTGPLTTTVPTLSKFNMPEMSVQQILDYAGVSAIVACLGAPLNAGLIALSSHADQEHDASFEMAFEYYRQPYFGTLALASLIIALISLLFTVSFQLMGLPLIGVLCAYAIALFCLLVHPLIIFANLSATDAIASSIRIVSKNLLIIAALVIVAGIFACTGVIACCIGVIFTCPIIYCMYYSIYVHSVGFDDEQLTDATIIEDDSKTL